MKRPHLLTLLTDFGTTDPYVASMKGVILGIDPQATIVDLTHEVPPQDLYHAAFVLDSTWRFFPRGTVHVVVVDPGVGGPRRALAAHICEHFFVAPDNGVLTPVLRATRGTRIVEITHSRYRLPHLSRTFHGRDLFAPVAAHLSRGTPLHRLGPALTAPLTLNWPQAHLRRSTLHGQIIHIDRFGNLITNITEQALRTLGIEPHGDPAACLRIRRTRIRGIVRSYCDAPPGSLLSLVGSTGRLEIARRDGSAAALHRNWKRGTSVTIEKTKTNNPSSP